jgi:O-methyltransferase involved in polyketide biosynthesis
VARHSRAFLGRAVRFCVQQGIRQFLDLGSGLPTVGNVHEIAHRAVPQSRVVYVDHEPIAVAHSRLVLQRTENVEVLLADLTDVDTVLSSDPVQQLLDLTHPIAVILAGVLHFVPDQANPHTAVARYVDAMAPGSYLIVSHRARTPQPWPSHNLGNCDQSSIPTGGRTHDQIHAFLTGTTILPPGLVWTPQWQPEFDPGPHPEHAMFYAAVGYKPSPHDDPSS